MDNQEKFEESVICESELGHIVDKGGDILETSMDNLQNYSTISEICSDSTYDIDFEVRNMLFVVIYERMTHLNKIQKEIANLRYIDKKTLREIAAITNKSLSTIHYHIERINLILRSIK